jgi:site-specific recombinase XerD
MNEVRWERYRLVAQDAHARAWLAIQANLGRAANTIEAYGRGLHDYLAFSQRRGVKPAEAGREHVAAYIGDLLRRPNPRASRLRVLDSDAGLANATLQQRLTAVRLYYAYLVEEGVRATNPIGRGQYAPSRGGGERGLVPRYRKLPWIPNEAQWRAVLEATRVEPFRNRLMLALAYDAGLRREELCALETSDIDPAARLIRVRAETTKGRRERRVPYSEATGVLYAAYLLRRRELSRERGPLFLSESRRNRARPISLWTWSKVVRQIALRADVPQFSTHTPRHLCLTDLARAGWELHEIAQFAGHRNPQTTLLYIHLSGRELAAKLERGMAAIHAWRVATTAEVLG